MDYFCHMIELMLDSGLPCFKGKYGQDEHIKTFIHYTSSLGETIKRLRYRFQPDRTEQQAAAFMLDRIKESFENRRTVWYDSFQKATNGM
jgi:phosphatidylinositol 4-kinase